MIGAINICAAPADLLDLPALLEDIVKSGACSLNSPLHQNESTDYARCRFAPT